MRKMQHLFSHKPAVEVDDKKIIEMSSELCASCAEKSKQQFQLSKEKLVGNFLS